MALLCLAHDWAREKDRSLLGITFDHRLRPEAAAEAAFVASVCSNLGVRHLTLTWDAPKGVQSSARRARHGALAAALRQAGGRVLLMAHTPSDQRETFLMRIRQGSGWYGLSGMPTLAPSPVWPEGRGIVIARPFLEVEDLASRSALREMLRKRNLKWCEDPSNENEKFERIRVRKYLEQMPQQVEQIDRLMSKFQNLRRIEDKHLAGWFSKSLRLDPDGSVHISALSALSQDSQIRALSWLLQLVSGKDQPPRRAKVLAVILSLEENEAMRPRTLHGVEVSVNRTGITLRREYAAINLPAADTRIFDNRFEWRELEQTPDFDDFTPNSLLDRGKWHCLLPQRLARQTSCLIEYYEEL